MQKSKAAYELADIVRHFGKKLLQKKTLSAEQTKALFNIAQCRTSALGEHKE